MLILGIDPGTGRTGWGIVNLEKEESVLYVAHGCVITSQDDPMHKRLHILYKELRKLVKQYSPEYMVVEQIFFGLNARTAISVSQARGVAMLVCGESNLNFAEYTPIAVKHLISGSGKTEKKEMQSVVRRHLSKNITTLSFSAKDKAFDDAADALAIAIHHAWKLSGKADVVLEKKESERKAQKALKKKKTRKV